MCGPHLFLRPIWARVLQSNVIGGPVLGSVALVPSLCLFSETAPWGGGGRAPSPTRPGCAEPWWTLVGSVSPPRSGPGCHAAPSLPA